MPGDRPIVLSIIIPLYNVEPWLSDCLESLMAGVLDASDSIEIILSDDASTDGTRAIAVSYVNRYPDKIRYIGRSNNGGPGTARNEAFSLAGGTYIWFFDGDDVAEDNLVAEILKNCNHNPDLLFLPMNLLDGSKKRQDPQQSAINAFTSLHGSAVEFDALSRQEALLLPFATWRYVFRRTIINDKPFCPTTCTEDLYFHFKLLLGSNNLLFITGSRVLYRQRKGQLTSRNHSSIWSLMSTFRYIRDEIVEQWDDKGIWNVFLMRFHSKLRNIHRKHTVVYGRQYRSDINRFWKEIPGERRTVYLRSRGVLSRLEILAIGTSFFPYTVVLRQLFHLPYRILMLVDPLNNSDKRTL